jgi:hypothetical protein
VVAYPVRGIRLVPEIHRVEATELAYWLGTDGHREPALVLPGVPA